MGRGTADFERAANTAPSKRTDEEKALVKEAHDNDMVLIKNLDHAAGLKEKYGQ